MRVDTICTRQVQTIQASEPLAAAARQMRDEQVGALIVVAPDASGRVVGILTDRDIICGQIKRKADLHCLAVEDVMTAEPLSVTADTDIGEVVQRLYGMGVRRAPVVTPDGNLVGIVTLDDLVPALAQQLITCAQLLAA
jgi:CBS domain-containing protein